MRRPLAVLSTAAATILMTTCGVGTAQANIGDILVQQQDSSGHTVCVQDYLVANLTPETIDDSLCAGVTTVRITNDTFEPITITAVGPPASSPSSRAALSGDVVQCGGDGETEEPFVSDSYALQPGSELCAEIRIRITAT
jgi:hypothetical protein